ncbi:MAG: PorT family protein [Prevotella sp.]|nr:PorT family protein [Prevotella sp.]MBR6964343.1 PorT family protein [Prevotella sp.]
MKKILVSIVAMVFAIPTFAQFSSGGFDLDKESMYYGVRIGMVGANLTGDAEASGMKIGLSLGGVIGIRISHTTPLFLESGLYYVGRGGKDGDNSVGYNNLEIPLLIKYGVKAGDIAVLPFFGPYFAYGISGKTKILGEKVGTFDEKKWDGLKRANMGLKLGCGLEFNKLYVEAGYQFGLSNITKHDDNSVHSNALFLNVGVNF